LLRYLENDRELAVLDRELESRLSAWFDVGFLELQRITWNSRRRCWKIDRIRGGA
jgi:malonyl-CoA decarboxylase